MGARECSKKGCDDVMCDTYINDIGYICDECKGEFKLYLESQNITAITSTDIKRNLAIFMRIYKGTHTGKMTVDEFFDEHTNKEY